MRKYILSIILAVIALLGLAVPVYADTANPDSTPEVFSKYVFRNLLETGDSLYIWYANVPYASLPATPFSQTFIWRLLDGATVLGSTTGYDGINDDGFNHAIFSMYFPASAGLVWEDTYTLRLSGNPVAFVTPPEYNFNFEVSDYTSLTTTADNQAELADQITDYADILNTEWGLAVTYYLTYQSGTSTVLSTYGEAYFMEVVFGLQDMATKAFEYIIVEVEISARTWSSNYTDALDDQWAGTWVQTAREGSQALLGTSYDLTSVILLFLVCFGLVMANLQINQNDHWGALIDVSFVLVLTARLGVYGLGFLALIDAICIIYIGMKLWGLKGA
jgi:hypothetical protein